MPPARVTVTVTGNRALVLASQSTLTLSSNLSLAGGNGVHIATEQVGAGGRTYGDVLLTELYGGSGRSSGSSSNSYNSGGGGGGGTRDGAWGSYNVAANDEPEPFPFTPPVPEPSALALLLLGVPRLIRRR